MAPLFRMLGRFTVVFYTLFTLGAFTTLYTVLFRLDWPPLSRELSLPPFLGGDSSDISDPISGSEFPFLSRLCNEAEWTEGLWLQCHNGAGPAGLSMRGGLNNLRNRLQTCVRLAISAGAGIIMPSFATRDDGDLLSYDREECPADLFDTERFERALSVACPQLKIRGCKDTKGLDTTIDAKFRKYLDPSYFNETFRAAIDDTIARSGVTRPEISKKKPLLILYGDPFLAWNYTTSAETNEKKDLFKTLRYNKKLSELGEQIFDALKQKSSGPIVAVHLRGEADWPGGVFGDFNVQLDQYTEALLDLRNNTLHPNGTAIVNDCYVSCGNPDAIRQFRERVEPLGYVVHSKTSVLGDNKEVREKIEDLRFDERAVTEYESLVSADYFIGLITSSLSDVVAYARTVDEEGDYFEDHIHPGTSRGEFIERVFPGGPLVIGNERTKLMVLTGPDLMDCFP